MYSNSHFLNMRADLHTLYFDWDTHCTSTHRTLYNYVMHKIECINQNLECANQFS